MRKPVKEKLIIYPIATETVSDKAWDAVYQQSFEYTFSFTDPPLKQECACWIGNDGDVVS